MGSTAPEYAELARSHLVFLVYLKNKRVMTKQESNSYAWLDAESVRHKQTNPRDDTRQLKQFAQKMLDFLDMY